MKKNLLSLILIVQIGILSSQNNQSELILGTWSFEKEVIRKTNNQKSDYIEVSWCPHETESGTGYPDLIFKKDNIIEKYYTKEHIEFGKWEIKKNIILIYRLIEKEKAEEKTKSIKHLLERKLIFKGNDGNYYFKPYKMKIRTITKSKIEFGTNEQFDIYKRKD